MIIKPEVKSLFHYQSLALNTPVQKEIDDRAIDLGNNVILDKQKVDPILNHEVYYSSPNSFNDPYEASYKFIVDGHEVDPFLGLMDVANELGLLTPIALTQLNSTPQLENELKRLMPLIAEKVMPVLKNMLGVYCLTRSAKDITMWAHYADNNKGIALEFERNEENICGLETFEINYLKTHPQINFSESLRDLITLKKMRPGFERMNHLKNSEFRKCIYSKSVHWEYEDEWRTIHSSPGLHAMPGKLKSIIFGYNTQPQVIEYFKTNLQGVDFKFMVFNKEAYKMEVCTEEEFEVSHFIDKLDTPNMELIRSFSTNL